MSNYNDEFWSDYNEFDSQIEEFKDALRNSVKDEIKEKIASLEKEVEELREFREQKDKIVKKYREAINSAKHDAIEAENKWKNARLHELLGDYLTVGWGVKYENILGDKCDKCDENRQVHFTSPCGREMVERCNCAITHTVYAPEERMLTRMSVRKKNFDYPGDKDDKYNRYYSVTDCDDYDRMEISSDIYLKGEDVDFERMSAYRAIFMCKEDCEKYCDWLNEREREKEEICG